VRCPNCGRPAPLFKTPKLTVDIIIDNGSGIVLVKRKNPPLGWALPGGFVDYGETLEEAALREAAEETGLRLDNLRQFRAYSDPSRDQRFHTVSMVFTASASGVPKGGDDAAEARYFPRDALPDLAFDHAVILNDYFRAAGSHA